MPGLAATLLPDPSLCSHVIKYPSSPGRPTSPEWPAGGQLPVAVAARRGRGSGGGRRRRRLARRSIWLGAWLEGVPGGRPTRLRCGAETCWTGVDLSTGGGRGKCRACGSASGWGCVCRGRVWGRRTRSLGGHPRGRCTSRRGGGG